MMGSLPLSVVMAVFNDENYVAASIESILGQTFRDFEFIVIDDGSTDGTAEVIRAYRDPRIIFIQNNGNLGLTRSLNIGLEIATGRWLARQDADDISLKHRFQKQIGFLKQHPNLALLGTAANYIDEKQKIIGRTTLSNDPEAELSHLNPFVHGSIMLCRSVAVELGGYDEFFRYCQDYELWARIARHHKVSILKERLYLFRQHLDNTRFQNAHDSSLYHLLTKKIIQGSVSSRDLIEIKERGLESLNDYMDGSDVAFHHKAVAHSYMRCGNISAARKEYKSALEAAPLNIRNFLNLVLVCCGRKFWSAFHRL